MRKQLDDTVFVEHVAAVEFDAGLLTKLTYVADRTKLITAWESGVFGEASILETGKAFLFISHSIALMTTALFYRAAIFVDVLIGSVNHYLR